MGIVIIITIIVIISIDTCISRLRLRCQCFVFILVSMSTIVLVNMLIRTIVIIVPNDIIIRFNLFAFLLSTRFGADFLLNMAGSEIIHT